MLNREKYTLPRKQKEVRVKTELFSSKESHLPKYSGFACPNISFYVV